MLAFFQKLLSKQVDQVKNFDTDTADMPAKHYHPVGVSSIETEKIVGSVGRAHELDSSFRYRHRIDTERYQRLNAAMNEGKPLDPIQVVKVKRGRSTSEYYVVDGHHRVAQAKQRHLPQMNANIVEVCATDHPGGC